MYTIYKVKANELDSSFLEALKILFKDKEIEIAICESNQNQEDETHYLLKSPINKEHLLKAIENVNHHRDLVKVDLNQLS